MKNLANLVALIIACLYCVPGTQCAPAQPQFSRDFQPRSRRRNRGSYDQGASACYNQQGYRWNGTMCVVNCNIPNSKGINWNATACLCERGYCWQRHSCVISCLKTSNSTGLRISSSQCQCARGFIWESDECSINCSLIGNSTGRRIKRDVCQCYSGFNWTNGKCVRTNVPSNPVLNCSNVPFSTGKNLYGNCQCIPNYYWYNKACVPMVSKPGTPIQSSKSCPQGYFWDENQRSCLVICNLYGSTGRRLSHDTCQCHVSFGWANHTCSACPLVLNSNGRSSNNVCECKNGFDWIVNACFERVPMLNSIPNQNNAWNPVNPIQKSPACWPGYTWVQNRGCVQTYQNNWQRRN